MRNRVSINLFILLIGMLTSISFAQNVEFLKYDFDNAKIQIPEKFKNEEEIVLVRNYKHEYVFDANESLEYYLFHEKKLLNSEVSLERNNRIYIPYTEKENLIKNELRVILPSGKVIKLRKEDIKSELNEQSGVTNEYFAINGLEKGAVIERFFILKRPARLSGSTFNLQGKFPIVNTTFELIYPDRLNFSFKSYNGLPDAKENIKAYEGKNNTLLEAKDIIGLHDDEKNSNWNKNVMFFRYKLISNSDRNLVNLYTHKDYVTDFYDKYYVDLSKNEIKDLDKFTSVIKKDKDPLLYIRSIERLIKESIKYNRFFKTNKTISDILSNKQGNIFDHLQLYIAVLNHLGIEHEVVFTTEKDDTFFDPDFETYENIQNVLIYTPISKSYIEPEAINYRTPIIDAAFFDNYGLFVKSKIYQNIKMPVSTTRKIEIPSDMTHDYMNIIIDASKGVDKALFASNIKFGGYSATYLQTVKEFSSEEEYNDMMQFLVKQYAYEFSEKAKVTSGNDGVNNIGLLPYVLDIEVEGSELFTKAGENYLIKIGAVIGKQMQMYSEEERQFPIEIPYPHFYTRTITLIIPEGYSIKNPEVLKMNYVLEKNGKVVADFISNFEINGAKLVIRNTENYEFSILPISDYPSYKKVINAAADFQKLNLVLEKNKG